MGEAKQVTRKDVAERAGVSVAVASYVVNNGPRPVSPQIQAKVEKATCERTHKSFDKGENLKAKQSEQTSVDEVSEEKHEWATPLPKYGQDTTVQAEISCE